MCIADCLSDFFFIYDIRLRLIRCLTNQLNLAHIIQQANQQHRILRHLLFGIGEFVPVCLAVDHDQIAQFNKMAVINTAYCKQGFLKSVLCTVQLRQIGADLIDLAFGFLHLSERFISFVGELASSYIKDNAANQNPNAKGSCTKDSCTKGHTTAAGSNRTAAKRSQRCIGRSHSTQRSNGCSGRSGPKDHHSRSRCTGCGKTTRSANCCASKSAKQNTCAYGNLLQFLAVY